MLKGYIMYEKVTYNQIIALNGEGITGQQLVGSYASNGKLILGFRNGKKLIIDSKNVYATGRKNRIRELVLMATEAGHTIPEKSVLHYATGNDGEYVLVRW